MRLPRSPLARFAACSCLLNLALAVLLLLRWSDHWRRPGLRAVVFEPANDETPAHFVLHFATDMNPEALPESLPVPFVFRPALEYDLLWESGRRAAAVPRRRVPPGTTYAVRPAARLADAAGRPLHGDPRTVDTDPFAIADPVQAVRLGRDRTRLCFRLNGAVTPTALLQHLQVTDERGRSLPCSTAPAQPSLTPCLVVEHPETVRRFRVRVAPGLLAEGADTPLAQAFESEILLRTDLTVGEVAANSDDDGFYLAFEVPGELDLAAAEGLLAVEPAVPCRLEHAYGGHYQLRGSFAPQTYYRVLFRQGLRTLAGQVLERDTARVAVTGHLRPLLRFASEGPYFPRHRAAALPLRVRNLERIRVSATRVYPNNLVEFLRHGGWDAGTDLGRRAGEWESEPALPADEARLLDLPLAPFLERDATGLFVLSAVHRGRRGEYWPSARQVVIVTDLALTAVAADDQVLVRVTSLRDARPVADCAVELRSYRDQPLGAGRTDALGTAVLPLARDPRDGESPYLVVARLGDDLSCLALDYENEQPVVQAAQARDNPGNTPGACEAFLYTERGICRPGETIWVQALLRERGRARGGVPAEFAVHDPQGTVVHTARVEPDTAGFARTAFTVPAHARTGLYAASLGTPATPSGDRVEWGRCSFQVGTYTPDRVHADLRLPHTLCRPGETLTAEFAARYYFGRPAADCAVTLRTAYDAVPFAPDGFAGYSFGNAARALEGTAGGRFEARTDADGKASFTLELPAAVRAPAAVRLTLGASVSEPGGRAVTAAAVTTLHPCPFYLGLKPLADAAPAPASDRAVAWAAVAPDGTAVAPPGPLRYTLVRNVWDYVLQEDAAGRFVRRWVKETVPAGEGDVPVAAGAAAGTLTLTCRDPGSYTLRVTAADGAVETALDFWHWQGHAGERPTNPQRLDLVSDRDRYRPGDTARITFTAAAPGWVFVTAGAATIEHTACAPVQAGENRVEVPIPAGVTLGSYYVALSVLRGPLPAGDAAAAPRLFGTTVLPVDQEGNRLTVRLDAPSAARPGTMLPVDVYLTRQGKPAAGWVQLMAIDEGILALTAFRTPDPFAFFSGPRTSPFACYDLFERIFPEFSAVESAAGRSAVGGDGVGAFLSPVLPERLRAAIVLLPPQPVSASGLLRAELALPEHTGALRLMAVAYSAEACGSGERPVELRREISLQLTAPRAVAPGDEFEVAAQAFNHDAPAADAHLTLTLDGPLEAVDAPVGTAPLAPGAEHTFRIRLRARPGEAAPARLRATLRLGEAADTEEAALAVRPPMPRQFQCGFQRIEPGAAQRITIPGRWLPGSGHTRLLFSTSPACETAGAVAWLRQYPYGCLEQTVSAALPLLVLDPLAGRPLPDVLAAETAPVLSLLLQLELPDGGFSMWPGSRERWTSASVYAAHFLFAAERRGLALDPASRERVLQFLRDTATRTTAAASASDTTYALYVLALAGRPEPGLAESWAADPDRPPFARFLAAAALLQAGRGRSGSRWLAECLKTDYLAGEPDAAFDSPTRRAGLALTLLADLAPGHAEALRLVEELRRRRSPADGHWGATQDNALAVLGLGTWLAAQHLPPDARRSLRLPDGRTVEVTPGAPAVLNDLAADAACDVLTDGRGPLFCLWEVSGVPLDPPREPRSHGLNLERRYLDEAGRPATTFRQGDLVRVELALRSPQPRDNVVVVDLLPGGLEIEDEALVTRVRLPGTDTAASLGRREKRDDRMLIFCSVPGDEVLRLTYTARAVSRGRFVIPVAAAEPMYEPQIHAQTAIGQALLVE